MILRGNTEKYRKYQVLLFRHLFRPTLNYTVTSLQLKLQIDNVALLCF